MLPDRKSCTPGQLTLKVFQAWLTVRRLWDWSETPWRDNIFQEWLESLRSRKGRGSCRDKEWLMSLSYYICDHDLKRTNAWIEGIFLFFNESYVLLPVLSRLIISLHNIWNLLLLFLIHTVCYNVTNTSSHFTLHISLIYSVESLCKT